MRTNNSIEVTENSETTLFCARFSMHAKLLQLTAFKRVLLQSSKLLRLEDLGRFSEFFCHCFVFRVCSMFRVLFRGGGLENLWKIELDWVLGIPFRVYKKNLFILKHFAWFSVNVTFLFKAFEIKWGKKASILGDHSIGVLIGKYNCATFPWPNPIASMKNWGTLGLQAVKALLGSIHAKDINSSNLNFWTCLSFHLFKILYQEMISNNFSYIF